MLASRLRAEAHLLTSTTSPTCANDAFPLRVAKLHLWYPPQYLDLSCSELDRLPQNLHLLTSLCGLEIDYHTLLLADCGLGSLVNLRLLLLDWDVSLSAWTDD